MIAVPVFMSDSQSIMFVFVVAIVSMIPMMVVSMIIV